MNISNAEANRKAASTANRPAKMGDHNENKRDDRNQISYNHFGEIINRLHKGLSKVTSK